MTTHNKLFPDHRCEYEAWMVATRPYLKKAVECVGGGGLGHTKLFLDKSAAEHEALRINALLSPCTFEIFRVLVRVVE